MAFEVNNAQMVIWWLLLVGVLTTGLNWFVGRIKNATGEFRWRVAGDIWDRYLSRGEHDHRLFHLWWVLWVVLLAVQAIFVAISAYLVNQLANYQTGWDSSVVTSLVLTVVYLVIGYPVTGLFYFGLGWRFAGAILYFVAWAFLIAAAVSSGLQRPLAGYLYIIPFLITTLFFLNLAYTAWVWRGKYPHVYNDELEAPKHAKEHRRSSKGGSR